MPVLVVGPRIASTSPSVSRKNDTPQEKIEIPSVHMKFYFPENLPSPFNKSYSIESFDGSTQNGEAMKIHRMNAT